jgi:ArsR family transcriptional regulator, zinc-responsive transcriptional repressor
MTSDAMGARPAGVSSPHDLHAACELLRALGAPHRLGIVLQLAEGTRCVHELVDALGISQSLASQHLRILRAAGLVAGVRRGKETVYSLAGGDVLRIAAAAVAHGGGQLAARYGRPPSDRETGALSGTASVSGTVRNSRQDAGDPR